MCLTPSPRPSFISLYFLTSGRTTEPYCDEASGLHMGLREGVGERYCFGKTNPFLSLIAVFGQPHRTLALLGLRNWYGARSGNGIIKDVQHQWIVEWSGSCVRVLGSLNAALCRCGVFGTLAVLKEMILR